jgi:hypothetical protein
MLESDYFERKRRELGLERADNLARVQQWLDERYPGQVRARQLHQGVLRLVTASAPLASELRMRQVELLAACELPETRLAIRIG